MKKNYQIPLCKKCWHIKHEVIECMFFSDSVSKPFTKETAQDKWKKKWVDNSGNNSDDPLIDYKKNTCRFFKSTKLAEERGGRGLNARDTHAQNVANRKCMNSGNYRGQS